MSVTAAACAPAAPATVVADLGRSAMKTLGLGLLIALSAFGASSLHYEPEEVTLRGVIHRQTFPGRPNYEDIAKGDEPEVYWIFELNEPADVIGTKDDKSDVTERGVQSIQLVFNVLNEKSYRDYPNFVGEHVVVVGQLFHAITAHHKTDVLISVRDIKKQPNQALVPMPTSVTPPAGQAPRQP